MIKTLLKWAFGAPMHIDDPDWEDGPPEISEGFPDHVEFRISPDTQTLGVWNPRLRKWILFHDVVVVREVHPMDTDAILGNWTPYLAVENGE